MSRSLIAFLLVSLTPALQAAGFMPQSIGPFHRAGAVKDTPNPPDVFEEFGLLSAQSADFRGRGAKGALTVYQMKDASGALAAWDWIRPANSKHCALADRCADEFFHAGAERGGGLRQGLHRDAGDAALVVRHRLLGDAEGLGQPA